MKFLLIAFGLMAIIVAVFLASFYFRPQATSVVNRPDTTTPQLALYTNPKVGLALRYDQSLQLSEAADDQHQVGDFLLGQATPIVTLRYPANSFAGTNFIDGYLTAYIARPGLKAADCQLGQYEGSTSTFAFDSSLQINGQDWYQATSSGAAAGTMVQTRLYHAWHADRCYELQLNIFESDIANSPEGQLKPVDDTKVFDQLDSIVTTVRLEDLVPPTITYLHQFSDFPATSTKSTVAKRVNYQNYDLTDADRQLLAQRLKAGPNFAGHYAIADWSCGLNCQEHTIIDSLTGEIVVYGLLSSYGLQYQADSSLLIVNPPQDIAELSDSTDIASDYYQLDNGQLKLLTKQKLGSGQPLLCIQVLTKARNPITNEVKEFPAPCSIPTGWEPITQ